MILISHQKNPIRKLIILFLAEIIWNSERKMHVSIQTKILPTIDELSVEYHRFRLYNFLKQNNHSSFFYYLYLNKINFKNIPEVSSIDQPNFFQYNTSPVLIHRKCVFFYRMIVQCISILKQHMSSIDQQKVLFFLNNSTIQYLNEKR